MAVEQTAGGETDGLKAPLPGAEQLEDALDGTDAESEAETVTPDVADAGDADGAEAEQRQEETRVLEFTLQDEHYCLDIEYIEEIVKKATITRVPNTPAFVEGVVDLRGQITTILNPKVTIGKEQRAAGELIVVFDGEAFEDQGHVGWVVDDVRQVSLITEDDVNEPPMDDDHINGVIDRDEEDEFVIWTTPNLVLDEAE
jgi:purine-binding chemotaxis protein CheW